MERTRHHHGWQQPQEDTTHGRGHGRSFGAGFGGFGPGFDRAGFGPGFGKGFGPGGPRARRGDVRSALLGLLAEQPLNGYGLIKAFAAKTDGAWKPSPGSIYPTLSQLVDEGLIILTDGNGSRSDYTLTDEGRAYVAEHAEEIAAAWQNAAGPAGHESHGEFRSSIGKLFAAVQSFRMATPEQQKAAIATLDNARKELYRILAE
ncbi:PadR family transcriptional regulator [Naasia lichenicola]|uniref:PadR family transcriptional regulator n=1 Tax=Naasia lichenicola TaxID=2565933 RepID=A0A4S4FHR4_9MICO|nr:PadR family transcriptional regulator [Naasia lichenicola]THG29568.1 PadR family transcriptional regulator [Naasia lichenicola]